MNLISPDVLKALVDRTTANLAKEAVEKMIPALQAALSSTLDGLEITIVVRRKQT